MDEKKKSSTAAVGAGAVAGGLVGAKIGIAGFFGAISGVVPLALLGAYAGHKIYKAVKDGAAEDFKGGFKAGFKDEAAELRVRREALSLKQPVVRAVRRKPPK